MKDNTIIYQRFILLHEAEELQQLLQQHNVGSTVKIISSGLDATFAGSYDKEYEVRINPLDRVVADDAVAQKARGDIEMLPKDHYLYSFTDDELMDVVKKRDEWNALDYQLALVLLKERGVVIDHNAIEKTDKQRITELSEPEKAGKWWLVAGYVFAGMGGLLGIVFGYMLYSSKKTLPDGRIMYRYNIAHRRHGKIIMILGLSVVSILWVINLWTTN